MEKKSDLEKWDEYLNRQKKLLIYGLENNLISPYDDTLIEKFRKVFYGGVPSSIILLSNHLCNGYCYDRALLLSRAFLDTDDDIRLIYAEVDSLKLNPKYLSRSGNYADHCVVERICSDGRDLIYDTSMGFVYDKDIYFKIENPKIRKINYKESIIDFINEDMVLYGNNNQYDPFVTDLVIPFIESTYNDIRELYARDDFPILQDEIEYYKKYNEILKSTEKEKYYGKIR